MEEHGEQIRTYAQHLLKHYSENDVVSFNDFIKKTGLSEDEFHLALGWLAKDGKITASGIDNMEKEQGYILLDINKKARKVEDVLMNQSKKNVATIAKISELQSNEVYAALGWLAREDKIRIYDGKTLQRKFSLKE